jgi:hypothetical protein
MRSAAALLGVVLTSQRRWSPCSTPTIRLFVPSASSMP